MACLFGALMGWINEIKEGQKILWHCHFKGLHIRIKNLRFVLLKCIFFYCVSAISLNRNLHLTILFIFIAIVDIVKNLFCIVYESKFSQIVRQSVFFCNFLLGFWKLTVLYQIKTVRRSAYSIFIVYKFTKFSDLPTGLKKKCRIVSKDDIISNMSESMFSVQTLMFETYKKDWSLKFFILKSV